jgi:DMSO/TMAO reductase YedYZ molybdopterin-dependent catalytic subunit
MLFKKKGREAEEEKLQDRLPPGQSLTQKWPVLHVGSVPQFNPATWDFYIRGLVKESKRFTWAEFSALPTVTQTSDMHCVTRWSKFDSSFEGIPVAEVMQHVELLPGATHVMVHADPSYTTNIALDDFLDDDVACWCPSCICGRVPSGSAGLNSWPKISRAFGRTTVTIITATPGRRNASAAL